MMLFVTVGTTEFDELLDEIDCDAFYNLLKELGYSKVIYQFGRGKHIPQSRKDITIVTLDFTPSISDFFAAADTIISHCGAGTLLECLKINKRVVAVVNDTLAGNHQDELFSKLLKEGYIVGYKTHRDVIKDLEKLKENLQAKVRKYQQTTKCILNRMLDN